MNESGDVLLAIAEGAFGAEHVAAELGEVLAGLVPGRSSAEEVTLFKSLGIGVEDLAAADLAYRNARRLDLGARVSF
jgi:ornithine cyclodeaminase/alanine dehydrogenase-like protein (mu-crystallin family)